MKHTADKVSDEQLNTFINMQFGAKEMGHHFANLSKDIELGYRACESHKISDLIRFAYNKAPHPLCDSGKRPFVCSHTHSFCVPIKRFEK